MTYRTTSIAIAITLTSAAGCLSKESAAPSSAPVAREAAPAEAAPAPPPAATATAEAEEAMPTDDIRNQPAPMAGQLTAGAWSDNDEWDFWLELTDGEYGAHLKQWEFSLSRRFKVDVTDPNGAARNVPVRLFDKRGERIWSARTDGDGEAVLFATSGHVGPFSVQVADQPKQRLVLGASLTVKLAKARGDVADAVDVMFVVDTTGSMGDELRYLQSELRNVAKRVETRTANEFELRFAASVYRDHSDEFLVKSNRFSTDVSETEKFLSRYNANGGGDFPEAVDEALDEAVHEHQWNPRARARLLFLVLDAPPHDDGEGKKRLHRAIRTAAAQGIKIVPVVGSGIDKPTEFLMRSMEIATNGTYVFLTDDSGIGNSHLEPTVGDYEVEKLNDLLVRLIVEEAS